jgi:mono/diheme cytochrome c family protein
MRRISIVLLLVLAAVTSCKKPAEGPAEVDVKALPPEAKLAADLQLFARGKSLDDDDARAAGAKLKAGGAAAVEAYVDGLLDKGLGGKFARELVIAPGAPFRDRHPMQASYTMKATKDGGEDIYYIREPCAVKDAVKVKPWWGGSEVLVCPSSYRPEVKGDKAGRTCGATMLDIKDSDVCGCGPMLVYCLKDKEMRDSFRDLLVKEVSDTAEHVVDKDLPIDQLFTMNESVGNLATEYLYRRSRVVSGEDATKLFPIEGYDSSKLRPRHEPIPGFHAGVLSMPVMMYSSDALRGVMRNFFESMWCTGVARSSVETEHVLALKKVDLRVGDGWKQLAEMNICTDCHARLDYGMQFFWGYPSSTMGVDFNLHMARHGKGPFFGNDIKDERGQADLTPKGFGELATQQPEFSVCMTHKIVDHVYNGSATSEDFEAVRETFASTRRIKQTLRAALIRYAERELASPTTKPAAKKPAPDALADAATLPVHADLPAGAERIPVSPALKKLIHTNCRECHADDDRIPLLGDSLTEKEMAYILDRVAFGAMPKDTDEIDDATRRAFVEEASKALFTDAADRKTAIAYYSEMMRSTPVHRLSSLITNVNAAADASKPFRPSGTENNVSSSLLGYSPSLGVIQGITAMKACSGKKGPDLEACVFAASRPEVITAGTAP